MYKHPIFNQALPRVCVIGAGSTGLAIIKALKDAHIPFVCYEQSDRVGGNWVFKNKNGMSAAYRSLHINTSRERMQFKSFPMPRDYPDFAHHSLVAKYFEEFVAHFGLSRFIAFERSVTKVEPLSDGTYRACISDGAVDYFDLVVVANGHHWDPRWPEPRPDGAFAGIEMHAHSYIDPREPHDFVGKRVVVVGMGNSAMDIASELGLRGTAERVYLSSRRGAWIVPKYMFGRPLDQPRGWFPGFLPQPWRMALIRALVISQVGRMEDFGLPAPDHNPGEAHPTISSEILVRIGSGDVVPKPQIRAFSGKRVHFVDGSEVEADAVIWCTGYNVSFPFFDHSFVAAKDNDLPLFRRAFRPDVPGLFFAGLAQPLGAIMPIAEAQGEWLAEYVTGRYALPTPIEMQADIDRERELMFARYVKSPRHTMQIDFDAYMTQLQVERIAGRRRARARGFAPSLLARAARRR